MKNAKTKLQMQFALTNTAKRLKNDPQNEAQAMGIIVPAVQKRLSSVCVVFRYVCVHVHVCMYSNVTTYRACSTHNCIICTWVHMQVRNLSCCVNVSRHMCQRYECQTHECKQTHVPNIQRAYTCMLIIRS